MQSKPLPQGNGVRPKCSKCGIYHYAWEHCESFRDDDGSAPYRPRPRRPPPADGVGPITKPTPKARDTRRKLIVAE